MCDDKGKDEDGEEGEGEDEQVEKAVVPPSDAVPHPRTVMVKAFNTVVTQTAVRCSRRPEDFAGEAVFQLDGLTIDENLSGARWWTGAARRVNLLLQVGSLIRCRSG